MPQVSVIIATRNRATLLRRCLQAIDQQSYRNFEIIVVDDGSDPEQLAQMKTSIAGLDAQARLITLDQPSDEGVGPAASRNAGVAQSQGEYIAFCDDDDLWVDPDHLQTAIAFLDEHQELGYYFADQQALTIDDKIVRSPWLEEAHHAALVAPGQASAPRILNVDDVIAVNRFPHLNTTVLRTSLFSDIGGFDETLPYSEDLCFAYDVYAKIEKLAYRPHIASHHFVPDPSLRANASTRVGGSDKDLIYVTIANRFLGKSKSTRLSEACRELGGYAYKRLASDQAVARNWEAASRFAKAGDKMLPSLKWRLYTLYLSLRASIAR